MAAKPVITPKEDSCVTVNLCEPVKFSKVRAILKKRGWPAMTLCAMVRIVLDEWIKDNQKK